VWRAANAAGYAARLLPGPLALAGFFLPWAHGSGLIAGVRFSGYTLVGFAGRLQALDLTSSQSGALWALRLLILGVAVAATWHTLLAPLHRWHPLYALSGWYLVAGDVVASAAGLYRAGLVAPPLGLLLWLLGAALFLAAEVGERLLRRA